MKDSQWTVDGDDVGVRLDKFLAAADRLGSRARAVAALERRKVYLNGAEAAPSDAATRLAAGDIVRVWIDRPGSARSRLRGRTLVGERRYVFGPETLRPIPFERQALHAYRLAFRHPVDGRPLEFEAPSPPDFAALIARLRRRH